MIRMNRKEMIAVIIRDLELLREKESFAGYAIDENLAFFKASQSATAYIIWLLFRAPKIAPERLLELTDFPLPEWVREMHEGLIEIERRKFPGLIKPLVNDIVEFIFQKNPRILVNFGCGGMEAERQVIERLKESGYQKRLIFGGVDKSLVVKEIARANLRGLEDVIDIYEVEELTQDFLYRLLAIDNAKHAVVLCQNDIFEMDKSFNERSFDLIFYSMFRHHLSESLKASLDRVAFSLAKAVIEYDNYKGWWHLIPPSIAIWNKPPLLNGAIFSRLKAPRRQELSGRMCSASLKFFMKTGTYLLKHTFEH